MARRVRRPTRSRTSSPLSRGALLLRSEIERRGLSINKACQLLGLSPGGLSRTLRGRLPELRTAVAIEREFGVGVGTWLQAPASEAA